MLFGINEYLLKNGLIIISMSGLIYDLLFVKNSAVIRVYKESL